MSNYNSLTGESADYNRLKDKFFKLVRTVKPTGKNTKPAHVQLAQEINEEIESKVHGGQGDCDGDEDAIDRAMHLSMALSGEEGDEKEEAAPDGVEPSSSSSSPSSSSSSLRRTFPSERNTIKRARPNAEVTEAVQALSSSLSVAISAQMEQGREDAKLAREQMAMQQQQMQAQLLQQQQQMSQLIAAITSNRQF